MIVFIILTVIFETIEKALEALEKVNSFVASHEKENGLVGFVKSEIIHEGKKIVVLDSNISSQEVRNTLQNMRNKQISRSHRHFLWPVYDFLARKL